MAPSYANLFLAKFKQTLFYVLLTHLHDMDILSRRPPDLHYVPQQNIHPTIKFTSNCTFTSIPFLDVNVSLINGKITTDLDTKPTDKHQYLLQSSCHPKHTKRAIPFSLALRLRRICSSDDTFTKRTTELKTYLNKRGYNLSFRTTTCSQHHTYRGTRFQRHFSNKPTQTKTTCYHI